MSPDMTTLGKIIGGGMPVGAYGGRADIMDAVSPVGSVYQAGTLSGNPVAMASGLATLTQLRDSNPYPLLEELTARLEAGFLQAAQEAGVPVQTNRVGSMLTLFFGPESVTDWDSASACDTDRFARYFWGMIDRGIYMPCSQFEALFVSASHSEELIDQTIEAAAKVLGGMQAG